MQYTLRKLRLSGLASSLELRLSEARGNQLDHLEFLELLLQDELNVREQRQIERRTKTAAFREKRTLDSFDFSFNPGIDRRRVHDLATGRFLDKAEDILLIGPPGVGKSHLAQAIGHELIKAGKIVLYRSIFDLLADLRDDGLDQRHERTMKRYLNHTSDHHKEFTPEEISHLKKQVEAARPKATTIKEGTQIMIGAPAKIPEGLVDALRETLKRNDEVTSARLGQVYIQAEGEVPHIALVVRTGGISDTVKQAMIKDLSAACSGKLGKGEHIDILIDEPGQISAGIITEVEPFHTKK